MVIGWLIGVSWALQVGFAGGTADTAVVFTEIDTLMCNKSQTPTSILQPSSSFVGVLLSIKAVYRNPDLRH